MYEWKLSCCLYKAWEVQILKHTCTLFLVDLYLSLYLWLSFFLTLPSYYYTVLFAQLNLLEGVCVTGSCVACHCEESVKLVDASTISV